ncbi:MAG: hypothetical protein J0M12_16200 [Deltaproteobacteria bacterium]|nr:hypothetical protein [Deltaproteobacteria bacterium]
MLRDTAAAGSGQGSSNSADAIAAALGTNSKTETSKKNDALGKNEFLNLLVTQLKNQDPMEPMKNDQFAVNLAQFSQLEQLIGINDKIGANSGTDVSTLAAYLGQQVTLNSDVAHVKNNNGGLIKVDLPSDASAVKVDLLDPVTGSVKESFDIGPLSAGKHTLSLANIATASGDYQVKVRGVSSSGGQFDATVHAAAVVNGFVPGPTPKLLTDNGEIDPANIIEVNQAIAQ